MAHLPLSTSMATILPSWSASTCHRMSRSYISLPRRAVSSFGRLGGVAGPGDRAETEVLACAIRTPFRRGSQPLSEGVQRQHEQ